MNVGRSHPLSKLSALFPHVMVPLGEHENMRDYIDVSQPITQKVVRELPKPTPYEVHDALYNMKNIVDSQELQIQRNMMEEEDGPTVMQDENQQHPQEQPIKATFTPKQEENKTSDMWWSEHEDSENKDYLHFLN